MEKNYLATVEIPLTDVPSTVPIEEVKAATLAWLKLKIPDARLITVTDGPDGGET